MSYFLSNINTGHTEQIDDVQEAINAIESSVVESELSNDDGEIIAEKMWTEGADGDELEIMWQGDQAVGTSKWMQKEWIAAHLKKDAA